MRAFSIASSLSLIMACGSRSEGPAPAAEPPTVAEDLGVRPQPGADLDGPIPLPARDARRAGAGNSTPLDLGTDRIAEPVAVPKPPPGGAVTFSFADGRRGWVARTPEGLQLPPVAYGDGKVYVSGGFDSVSFYAVNAETGAFEWATTNLEDNGPTAAVFDDGRVIFNTESCTLFALDAATGKRLWFKYLGDPTLAQIAVADGLVFSAHPSPDGPRLSAYKVTSGARVWSRRVSAELLAAPIVHGDSVYASTLTGMTYRFDRARGKRVWARRLRATTAPWIVGDELFVSRRHGTQEQQIVVAAASGEIVREHHAVDGKHLRDVPLNLDSWPKVWQFEGSRPVVVGGVRYVAMGGELQASDARTGEALWVRRVSDGQGKRALGSVALAGPQVVVSSRDGKLFGLDIDTGYTLWAYDLAKEVLAEPIVARGWVYAATSDGYVVALEVGDRTLDGWHMFGGNAHHNGPVALARDPKTASLRR
ncbi:MAG TPA: PQQ-binding-like beta-propeller repeat protein [Kofleriaceae bacterium]|nr:PQQ-binding-like beta-propeller repeat protein [Kofleriaceae bacterium]